MRYTLRQLEVFVSVGRYESVSRAAAALALSQSATSTALGEFERQFDSQLFDRVGKTLRLNELGSQLLPKAVELLDRAREIEELLEGKTGFGALQIGAPLTIGNYLAALIIAAFLQRHPESRVRLQVQNTSTIEHRVAHHELDLGLIEGDCQHPDIEVQSRVEDEIVLCITISISGLSSAIVYSPTSWFSSRWRTSSWFFVRPTSRSPSSFQSHW